MTHIYKGSPRFSKLRGAFQIAASFALDVILSIQSAKAEDCYNESVRPPFRFA